MPQALPAKPDLDWLRKAAKARLAELRSRRPDAKLHQAQFAVANDYGFRSWRALKAHVDGIVQRFATATVFSPHAPAPHSTAPAPKSEHP